jgi:hypothetical protein
MLRNALRAAMEVNLEEQLFMGLKGNALACALGEKRLTVIKELTRKSRQ